MCLLLLLYGLFALSFHVIYINYVIVIIPFPLDLGIKILIGLRGLCKTFNSISLHVIL